VSKESVVRLKCHLFFDRVLYRQGSILSLKQIPENLRGFVTDDLSEPEQVRPQSIDAERRDARQSA